MHTPTQKFIVCPQTPHFIRPLGQGIIKAFKEHCRRALYTKACETLKANKKTTMMDYWKSVTLLIILAQLGAASDQPLSIAAGKIFDQTAWRNLKVSQKL
jgi:hypothetical protein